MLSVVFSSLSFFATVLLGVAFFTLVERKFLGSSQLRKGPEVVGWMGTMQPFSDGMKLFSKEYLLPFKSNFKLFLCGPVVMLGHSFILWACSKGIMVSGIYFFWGGLYIVSVLSVGIYGVMVCGWASNSHYALFGAVRGLAQVISYEVMLIFLYLCPLILGYSLDVLSVSEAQASGSNGGVLFIVLPWWGFCILAETNRAPFDFVEGESELVSGFNVEYGSGGFGLVFIAEYSNIIFLSSLTEVLFFGLGVWSGVLVLGLVYVIILCRSSFPRFRYDLLMHLIWCLILPLLMSFFALFICLCS